VLTCSYVQLQPGDKELVDQLWRLYKLNGMRNGQVVVSKRAFKRIHLAADGLSVMLVRDTSRSGAIVCFATGLKVGDTLVSTWCGTGECWNPSKLHLSAPKLAVPVQLWPTAPACLQTATTPSAGPAPAT
jgi:hypothetical protein